MARIRPLNSSTKHFGIACLVSAHICLGALAGVLGLPFVGQELDDIREVQLKMGLSGMDGLEERERQRERGRIMGAGPNERSFSCLVTESRFACLDAWRNWRMRAWMLAPFTALRVSRRALSSAARKILRWHYALLNHSRGRLS
ncbi:hypothetical protein BDV95DRAFT_316121 [Massariosphaeria phaeospora]|uniref:Uncharacterized protein n=1 Tax=Massariosphaeria phaeospora TaxID=100035 RepID=A0A7C8IF81_9PLEO|nr:hypothetical protein BDV95DRAFT_316121 [Massariosphaeria phaeospora]